MHVFNSLQLKQKLLVLGVLPAAVLAIILSFYFTHTRLADIDELIKENENNILATLSNSSIYGVFTGNTDSLDGLLQSMGENPSILAAQIINNNGEILSSIDKQTSSTVENNIIHLEQNIVVETPDLQDEMSDLMLGTPTKNQNELGTVSITFSRQAAIQRQQSILINSFYITALLLLIIGFAAYQIGRAIGKPILKIAAGVDGIKQGDYNYAAPESTNQDEVSRLAAGVEDMAVELKTHHQQLKNKISQATKELKGKNQKLRNAQRRIVQAADAKSRFVSHISHEIRTPLNGIIGFLEIIQTTPLSFEQKELVQASLASSKNLHQIINEVLDIAQLEAHKIRQKHVDFDISHVTQAALTTLTTQAQQNSVAIVVDIATTEVPQYLHQDPVKIRQILINLLNNAIKFSPNSTVTLKIFPKSSVINELTFEVSDHGAGIAQKDMASLFDEFSQTNTACYEQGSGLGLAISHQFVDALGGTLVAESELGKGSIFSFSIPYKTASAPLPDKTSLHEGEENYPNLSGLNILVADDNEMNRLLLTKLFEGKNITIRHAVDGQTAIDLSQEKIFDLLVLDLRMPVYSGTQVLEAIRSDKENTNKSTPAIAITAHITSGTERAELINSFDGYLTKPINSAYLFSMIDKIVHDSRALDTMLSQRTKSNNSKSSAIFDLNKALSAMNQDKALLKSCLNRFITELSEDLVLIKELVRLGDYEDAAEKVHKVHGSAAYCGTFTLKKAAKHFEEALRNKVKPPSIVSSGNFYDAAFELIAQQGNIILQIERSA
jgi:two-component system sensor histidine kinase BarA